MAQSKRTRGRPPGTGINDRHHLEQIRSLIAKGPSLRPTTAIRQLGIDNDSTIRRLRDKYRAELSDARHTTPAHKVSVKRTDPAAAALSAAAQPLSAPRDPSRQAQPAATGTEPLEPAKRSSNTKAPGPQAVFDADFNIRLMATAMAATHFIAYQQAVMWQAAMKQYARATRT